MFIGVLKHWIIKSIVEKIDIEPYLIGDEAMKTVIVGFHKKEWSNEGYH